jgi:hypothetical protein
MATTGNAISTVFCDAWPEFHKTPRWTIPTSKLRSLHSPYFVCYGSGSKWKHRVRTSSSQGNATTQPSDESGGRSSLTNNAPTCQLWSVWQTLHPQATALARYTTTLLGYICKLELMVWQMESVVLSKKARKLTKISTWSCTVLPMASNVLALVGEAFKRLLWI